MKLLIIADNDVWGGSELLWYHLQKRDDVDAVVWSPHRLDWLPKDVAVYRPKRSLVEQVRGWPAADPLGAFRGDAVLYVVCYFSPYLVEQLTRYVPPLLDRGLPVTILVQAVGDAQWISDAVRARLLSIAGKVRWVFVSQANADTVRKQVPAINDYDVVYNIPFRDLDPLPLDKKGSWAYVGRCHVESKGVDLLVESCVDFPVTVDIYGTGPNFEALRDYAQRLGSNVRFHGHRDDIIGIWQTHPVLVMCSRLEGTPLALLEAGLCGRPVVATRVGGVPEIVTEGAGILTEVNVSAIREGMFTMLQRAEEWESMGAALRQNCLAVTREDPLRRLADVLRHE
ncbi:MAG: glycosyltransferase family 4 protein [Thermoanaerobaculia bacterium]